jgi:ankyrin repeat protein
MMDTVTKAAAIFLENVFPEPLAADEYNPGACHEGTKIYRQLDASRHEIRLLKFVDSLESEGEKCSIETFPLDGVPSYTAVSYAWGSRSTHRKIELNGHSTYVAENLWRFLSNMSTLYQKRYSEHCHWFWIDALCIDQSSMKERKEQVMLMAAIYSKADKVLVWLGPAYQGNDEAMKALARPPTYWQIKKCYLKLWKSSGGTQIMQLCRRRYWTRLWTFQELEMAKEITLMCGTRFIPWTSFESFLLGIDSSPYCLPAQHEHARLSLLESPAMSRVTQKHAGHDQTPLVQLMEATRNLRCSEPRDKVYALLGVVDSKITPDYNIPLGVLLNLVLRDHHTMNPPKGFQEIMTQCRNLCSMLEVELESMFRLQSGWVLTPISSGTDLGRFPLSAAPGFIDLWWSAYYDHTAITSMILNSGRIGQTDLIHACEIQCTPAVELLLKVGPFDINGKLTNGNTILSNAIRRGQDAVALCMIAHSACDINLPDSEGFTPFIQGIMSKRLPVLAALFHRADFVFNNLAEALSDAIVRGDDDIARCMIAHPDCNINLQDSKGVTQLMQAITWKRPRILAALLQRPDLIFDECSEALLRAIEQGETEIVQCILDSGHCDADYKDSSGRNALSIAFEEQLEPLASLLVKRGVSFDSCKYDLSGTTALTLASHYGWASTVSALLDGGANPNEQTIFGDTPLTSALNSECAHDVTLKTVQLLLLHGANPNVLGSDGESPLTIAIRRGNREALIQLIEKHANVEARDRQSNTALMVAAEINDIPITTLLLSKGNARRAATNKAGQTAYDIAKKNEYHDLAEMLWTVRVRDPASKPKKWQVGSKSRSRVQSHDNRTDTDT